MARVLVVDDDKSTLTLLRLHLARAGYDISATMDAAEAVRLLEESAFDWLVMDGQMEPIDGFALADKAKELQPGIRVVMISGVYELPDITGHPIRHLFQKPVDPDVLVSYLRSSHERASEGR